MPEISDDEKRMIEIEEQAEAAAKKHADAAADTAKADAPPDGPAPIDPAPAWAGPPVANGAGVNAPKITPVVPWPDPPPPPMAWGEAPSGAMATREQPTALVPTVPAPLAETATTAAAAQAKAAVEARYVVAWRNPRSDDAVRGKLLRECKRPSFAKVARYAKPIGRDKIEGPSIRFAEAAMRCMGNMLAETSVLYDDDDKRIVRVMVTDLETNMSYPKDIVITKLVERRYLRKGQEAISSRTNASGQITHTVRASEDDLLNKEGALISKAIRTCALRLIPGDLVDEAMDLCLATQRDAAAKDPDAERKSLADGFAQLNVTAADLEQYLGHDLSKCSPAQLVDLRAVFAAVREGETTWAAVLEAAGAATAPAKSGAENLKAALGKKS